MEGSHQFRNNRKEWEGEEAALVLSRAVLWAGHGRVIQGVGWHWPLISSLFLPQFHLTCRMKMILTYKLILNLRIKCAAQKNWILLAPQNGNSITQKSNCPLYSLYRQKIVERIMFPPTRIFQQSFFMCLNEGL